MGPPVVSFDDESGCVVDNGSAAFGSSAKANARCAFARKAKSNISPIRPIRMPLLFRYSLFVRADILQPFILFDRAVSRLTKLLGLGLETSVRHLGDMQPLGVD
jgi:hypothetical protein